MSFLEDELQGPVALEVLLEFLGAGLQDGLDFFDVAGLNGFAEPVNLVLHTKLMSPVTPLFSKNCSQDPRRRGDEINCEPVQHN